MRRWFTNLDEKAKRPDRPHPAATYLATLTARTSRG